MDWLEENARKLKQSVRDASIMKAAAVYLFIALLGSLACIRLTVNLTSLWINVMSERVPLPDGEIRLLRGVRDLCPSFFIVASTVIAGRFFLKDKIKSALSEIDAAVKYLAAGDLSHEAVWQSEDEFGLLIGDVENLREILKRDKLNQWRTGDEQRQINAAFAHDIRTPLTVMKGYTEFLKKYIPEGKVTEQQLLEKLDRISAQGDRLLSFSGTMTTLRKMEEREVHCRQRETAEICSRMRETVEGMGRQKIRIFISEQINGRGTVFADPDLIMEAVENVLQNALRYAREEIRITVQYRNNRLTVYVKDDGEGFSENALRAADTAYFREGKEGEAEDGHFGIGLSITKMLCEKHGGDLRLVNSTEGGAVAAVSFYCAMAHGDKKKAIYRL